MNRVVANLKSCAALLPYLGYAGRAVDAAEGAEVLSGLLAAAECAEALDMPADAGWPILERHGWDRTKRFDLTATEFVTRLRRAAVAKATTQNKEATP